MSCNHDFQLYAALPLFAVKLIGMTERQQGSRLPQLSMVNAFERSSSVGFSSAIGVFSQASLHVLRLSFTNSANNSYERLSSCQHWELLLFLDLFGQRNSALELKPVGCFPSRYRIVFCQIRDSPSSSCSSKGFPLASGRVLPGVRTQGKTQSFFPIELAQFLHCEMKLICMYSVQQK